VHPTVAHELSEFVDRCAVDAGNHLPQVGNRVSASSVAGAPDKPRRTFWASRVSKARTALGSHRPWLPG